MKLAFLASALFAVAACGGSSTPAPAEPEAKAAGGPIYAALFTEGATWTFDVHSEDGGGDGEPEMNKSNVVATCKVAAVRDDGGVQLAEVTCDDEFPFGGDTLRGVWASNAEGVWHFDGALADYPTAPALDAAAMLLGATPTARKDHVEDPEMGDSFFTDTTVEQKGDAWCWSELTAGGDEGWASICFDAAGPTEGTFGWAGGSVHENTFTRAK